MGAGAGGKARSRPRVYHGWYVVGACGIIACFSWGLGFYGLGVYLSALRRIHGWSTSLLSLAVTVYYLASATALVAVGGLISRRGPRPVLIAGILAMGASVAVVGSVTAPWQLFGVYLLMAVGWASLSATALSATLMPWFERRRGLAVTLALTGASVGGMVLVPVLVHLIEGHGLRVATAVMGAALVVIGLPLATLVVKRSPADVGLGPDGMPAGAATARTGTAAGDAGEREWSRGEALASSRFQTLSLAFALALAAQVGFLVHQLSMLEPWLSPSEAALVVSLTTLAALLGRVGAGVLADVMDRRLLSATIFALQAVGLALIAAVPSPLSLYVGSAAFGLGVGNVITLPPLIAHDEFGGRSFGMVFGMVSAAMQMGVALGPSLVGVIRDTAGGDGRALALLVLLDALAVAIVLCGRPRPGGDEDPAPGPGVRPAGSR